MKIELNINELDFLRMERVANYFLRLIRKRAVLLDDSKGITFEEFKSVLRRVVKRRAIFLYEHEVVPFLLEFIVVFMEPKMMEERRKHRKKFRERYRKKTEKD